MTASTRSKTYTIPHKAVRLTDGRPSFNPDVMLHIDIETFSSVDLKTSGVYAYAESPDFEILLFGYAFDDGPVQVVDLVNGEMPPEVLAYFDDPQAKFAAHNAQFERVCLNAAGLATTPDQWHCSAAAANYYGLPASLKEVAEALKIGDKKEAGSALIKFFSVPVKATKVNEGRRRNMPDHASEKWAEFIDYCYWDVVLEQKITKFLGALPAQEHKVYVLDQIINDRGVACDLKLADAALSHDRKNSKTITAALKSLTGVDNPNSPAQLKAWLSEATGKTITSLAKTELAALIEETDGVAKRVLQLRQRGSKTSIKKYRAMKMTAGYDGRIRGLFKYYGASRTGRWAGRLVQLQNLPQNHLDDLGGCRTLVRDGSFEAVKERFDDSISETLSQLIRTAFVAPAGHTFAVVDFSAIEARVIAWLAGESWRLDVFAGHGKIYEASASRMFGVPIEEITKGSDLRQKGKVAELALGYQGSVGALTQMGGERMGLTEAEMKRIVKVWRAANPKVVELWDACEKAALAAVRSTNGSHHKVNGLVTYAKTGNALRCYLPSGRHLSYWRPFITANDWGAASVGYWGVDQQSRKFAKQNTYGGKLVENVVQAIARDLLSDAMLRLAHLPIVMHVHDEVVIEVPTDKAEQILEQVEEVMSTTPEWAQGLPLAADGYITPYYKKD